MMARTRNISLDIGGTFIKCSDGRKVPVKSDGTKEQIASAMKEAVGPTGDLASIGVCAPGPFDYRQGIFLMKHKFAAVYGESFRSLTGIPDEIETRFVHDVVAPLQGLIRLRPELRRSVVGLVTLGTGLGFSYAVDGEVVMDEMLSPAFSLYNLPYKDSILEDYVSRRAILREYGKPAEGDVGGIAALARAGNPDAREAFRAVAASFADCAGPHLRDLGITTLLFGGQIAKAFDLMEATLRDALPEIEMFEVKNYEEAVIAGTSIISDP